MKILTKIPAIIAATASQIHHFFFGGGQGSGGSGHGLNFGLSCWDGNI